MGRKVTVNPNKYHDWNVTANLWGTIVGRPSTKKTPALSQALYYLNKLDEDVRKDNVDENKMYQATVKMSKLQQRSVEKDALKENNKEVALMMLIENDSDNIKKPPNKRYIIHDATVEKVGILLSENNNGLLIERDELSGFLKDLDKDKKAEARGFYLMGFNGNISYSYDRVTRDSVFIPNCIVSIIGGIQPSKIKPYLMAMKNGTNDDGMMQRFQLLVYPNSIIQSGIDKKPDTQAKKLLTATYHFFSNLSETPENEEPIALNYAPQAQELYYQWEERNIQKSKLEKSPSMESHLSKYPAFISSLSLIIHLADEQSLTPISEVSFKKAIQLVSYFESHARRLYGMVEVLDYSARSLAIN